MGCLSFSFNFLTPEVHTMCTVRTSYTVHYNVKYIHVLSFHDKRDIINKCWHIISEFNAIA